MDKLNSRIITILFLAFFLSPIVIILYFFKFNLSINFSDFIYAFKNSVLQSVCTTLICIFSSLLIVPGLSICKNKLFLKINRLALIPSVLPSLFTILIVFSFFKNFPFGHTGIIIIFSITYFGFSTLALLNSYNAQVDRYSEIIRIYNLSMFNRYFKVYLPEMKYDILNVSIIIILGCFSSLSVPLLAGGGRGFNLELLIYESIFINGAWQVAALFAIIQIVFVFIMTQFVKQKNVMHIQKKHEVISSKKISLSSIVFLTYIGLYFITYFFQVIKALLNIQLSQFSFYTFFNSLQYSLALAIISIIIFLVLLFLILYLNFKKTNHQFLLYFVLPSSSVVGLSIYLLFSETHSAIMDCVKIAMGLNMIYFITLYKTYIAPFIFNMIHQIDISKLYGLNFKTTLLKIILPQIANPLFFCINIIFIFCFSEFALIKASGVQTLFSGLCIENLISTYRLDLGFIYSFFIFCVVFLFFIFTRFIYVKD